MHEVQTSAHAVDGQTFIRYGGFRIEVYPDQLTVTPDPEAWKTKKPLWLGTTLRVLFVVFIGIVSLASIASADDPLLITVIVAVLMVSPT